MKTIKSVLQTMLGMIVLVFIAANWLIWSPPQSGPHYRFDEIDLGPIVVYGIPLSPIGLLAIVLIVGASLYSYIKPSK